MRFIYLFALLLFELTAVTLQKEDLVLDSQTSGDRILLRHNQCEFAADSAGVTKLACSPGAICRYDLRTNFFLKNPGVSALKDLDQTGVAVRLTITAKTGTVHDERFPVSSTGFVSAEAPCMQDGWTSQLEYSVPDHLSDFRRLHPDTDSNDPLRRYLVAISDTHFEARDLRGEGIAFAAEQISFPVTDLQFRLQTTGFSLAGDRIADWMGDPDWLSQITFRVNDIPLIRRNLRLWVSSAPAPVISELLNQWNRKTARILTEIHPDSVLYFPGIKKTAQTELSGPITFNIRHSDVVFSGTVPDHFELVSPRHRIRTLSPGRFIIYIHPDGECMVKAMARGRLPLVRDCGHNGPWDFSGIPEFHPRLQLREEGLPLVHPDRIRLSVPGEPGTQVRLFASDSRLQMSEPDKVRILNRNGYIPLRVEYTGFFPVELRISPENPSPVIDLRRIPRTPLVTWCDGHNPQAGIAVSNAGKVIYETQLLKADTRMPDSRSAILTLAADADISLHGTDRLRFEPLRVSLDARDGKWTYDTGTCIKLRENPVANLRITANRKILSQDIRMLNGRLSLPFHLASSGPDLQVQFPDTKAAKLILFPGNPVLEREFLRPQTGDWSITVDFPDLLLATDQAEVVLADSSGSDISPDRGKSGRHPAFIANLKSVSGREAVRNCLGIPVPEGVYLWFERSGSRLMLRIKTDAGIDPDKAWKLISDRDIPLSVSGDCGDWLPESGTVRFWRDRSNRLIVRFSASGDNRMKFRERSFLHFRISGGMPAVFAVSSADHFLPVTQGVSDYKIATDPIAPGETLTIRMDSAIARYNSVKDTLADSNGRERFSPAELTGAELYMVRTAGSGFRIKLKGGTRIPSYCLQIRQENVVFTGFTESVFAGEYILSGTDPGIYQVDLRCPEFSRLQPASGQVRWESDGRDMWVVQESGRVPVDAFEVTSSPRYVKLTAAIQPASLVKIVLNSGSVSTARELRHGETLSLEVPGGTDPIRIRLEDLPSELQDIWLSEDGITPWNQISGECTVIYPCEYTVKPVTRLEAAGLEFSVRRRYDGRYVRAQADSVHSGIEVKRGQIYRLMSGDCRQECELENLGGDFRFEAHGGFAPAEPPSSHLLSATDGKYRLCLVDKYSQSCAYRDDRIRFLPDGGRYRLEPGAEAESGYLRLESYRRGEEPEVVTALVTRSPEGRLVVSGGPVLYLSDEAQPPKPALIARYDLPPFPEAVMSGIESMERQRGAFEAGCYASWFAREGSDFITFDKLSWLDENARSTKSPDGTGSYTRIGCVNAGYRGGECDPRAHSWQLVLQEVVPDFTTYKQRVDSPNPKGHKYGCNTFCNLAASRMVYDYLGFNIYQPPKPLQIAGVTKGELSGPDISYALENNLYDLPGHRVYDFDDWQAAQSAARKGEVVFVTWDGCRGTERKSCPGHIALLLGTKPATSGWELNILQSGARYGETTVGVGFGYSLKGPQKILKFVRISREK